MNTPLEITFQGVEKSHAIEAKIAERAAKLERHFDRITHMRVVVAAPHRHSHKGKIYQIKIEVGLPERAPVVIAHDPEVNHAHEDLLVAIRDAFDARQAPPRRQRGPHVGHRQDRARPTQAGSTGKRVTGKTLR